MAISALPWLREERAPASARTVVFPGGLPGFEQLRRFRLSSDPAFTPPFQLLASEEEPSIGFYLMDPKLLDREYDPPIAEADERNLLVQPDDEIMILAIVTVGSDPANTTANLVAPIILNLSAGMGCQAILEDSRYSLRAPLLGAAD